MIKENILKIIHHWKLLLKDKAYVLSFAVGLIVFAGSLVVNQFASTYQDAVAYAPVGDLILDRLPTYNLDFLFTWGFYFLVSLFFIYPILFRPEIGPFVLKTFAMLSIVRSAFIILTHIGPPAGFFYNDVMISFADMKLMFKNDLFFSGHTSAPFLAFLLFRKSKIMKWVMLFGSFIMGATVLLMHVHYSIDVFAAFFIAYGVYAFSDKVFNHLNLRFKRKIKLYGWNSLQKRLASFRKKREYKNLIKAPKREVFTTFLNFKKNHK